MKALLKLHWHLFLNHLRRRFRYLQVYLNGGGLITYLWVGGFFLFALGWYFYSPYTRIPEAVQQYIVLGGIFVLFSMPLFWLLGGVIRSKSTPILMSGADVHFLPLLPLQKSQIIWEQWLWPMGQRAMPSLIVPVLVYPFVHLFWQGYAWGSVFFMQWLWLFSACLGLCIQWMGAAFFSWLEKSKFWHWLKTGIAALGSVFILTVLFNPLPINFLSFSADTGKNMETSSGLVEPPDWSIPSLSSSQTLIIVLLLSLLVVIWVGLLIKWYSLRKWEPILSQSEKVLTIRTLVRARDIKALRRLIKKKPKGLVLKNLMGRLYFSSKWALAWKGVLSWRGISWMQVLVSLLAPLFLIKLLAANTGFQLSPHPIGQLVGSTLYFAFPMALFTLNAYTQLLGGWQEDLEQMEKFKLLPLYPRQIIVSSIIPSALLTGALWSIGILCISPYEGSAFLLGILLAFLEGILGALLVGREMLKDPSSATSSMGPERLISGVAWLAGPVASQWMILLNQSAWSALALGCGISGILIWVWIVLMENDWVFLRSRYEG